MPRTHTALVKEIVTTSMVDLTPFITAANLIVTNKLSSSGLGTATLAEIERWLAAHFVACKERQPTSKRIGETEESYNWNTNTGLLRTTYGQAAIALDTTGTLSKIGKPQILFDVAMDLPTDTD